MAEAVKLNGHSEMNHPNTYNISSHETAPTQFSNINGSTEEILARWCISELCKGWPVYRDASEWRNYRELFADEAYVFTTWSGGMNIDDFITVSKKGRDHGDFIMHRENGTRANVNLQKGRGIGKMKATITQRFIWDDVMFDVECDCRFIFYAALINGEWKTKYVKLFYEKDKLVPVDGHTIPRFDPVELAKYPEGYQYLAVAQAKLGHIIVMNLPTLENAAFTKMNLAMEKWLNGEDVEGLLDIPQRKAKVLTS